LHHPNIVTIYAVEQHEDVPFLTMEIVEGKTLEQVLVPGPLEFDVLLRIAITISDALAAAHAHHITHRDLKPANVMVAADGKVKLLDFGLAKLQDRRPDSAPDASTALERVELTRRGFIVGTCAYMSPEQAQALPVDHRSDIFSFGTLLHEMATGERPFKGNTAVAVVSSILRDTPRPVSELRPGFPPALDTIVRRCLAKEPESRYQSAADLRHALEGLQHLRHPPGTAANRSSFRRTWAGAMLLLVALAGLFAWRWVDNDRHWTRNTAVQSRHRRSVAILGFRNVSARPEASWLSGAFAQCLITELSAGEQMRVISDETVARMKVELAVPEAESLSPQTLARVQQMIAADLVVLGSFIAIGDGAGDQIRLDVRVQDTAKGETLFSVSETGTQSSFFDLIARVGETVRTRMGLEGGTDPEARALRATLPTDPQAARLYIDGLHRLHVFDALGARDLLFSAALINPDFALVHSALADAFAVLGDDKQATTSAKRAFELASSLSLEQRLWIEGVYRQFAGEKGQAASVFATLFERFPDDVEYGLRVMEVRASAGDTAGAFSTLERLRALPLPLSADPRIDLMESETSLALADFARARDAARSAARTAEKLGASLLVARSRINEAWALSQLGRLDEASAANQSAMALYERAGDRRGVSRALIQLGSDLRKQGRATEAAPTLQKALQIARTIGNFRNTAGALNNLGTLAYERGDLREARSLWDQAVTIYRDIGDNVRLGQALDNLASVLYELGDPVSAQPLDREALHVRRAIGNKAAVARSLVNIAESMSDYFNNSEARTFALEAVAINRSLSNKAELAYSLVVSSRILLRGAAFAEAKASAEEAQSINDSLQDAEAIAESRLVLAEVLLEAGDHKKAESLARQAATSKDVEARLKGSTVAARALIAQGNRVEARAMMRESLSAAADASLRTGLQVQIASAAIEAADGKETIALRHLTKVSDTSRKNGLHFFMLRARLEELSIKRNLPWRQSGGVEADLRALATEAASSGYELIASRASSASADASREL
jgi:eukaryotic-like serine/threonine-protein kinase